MASLHATLNSASESLYASLVLTVVLFYLASAYDIRQSNDFDTFLDDGLFASAESVDFKNFTGNATVVHQFTIVVTENTSNTLYVALKAVDDASNYGPISNIVTISLQDSIVIDTGDNDEVLEDTTLDSSTIIIGVVVSIVLLLLILSSVFMYKFLLKKKTQGRFATFCHVFA